MDLLLFYLGPLPPALLICQAILVWLWLHRTQPRRFLLRALCCLASTTCSAAGLLLFAGLWIGRFWYLRSSSEICGGEIADAPVMSSYFPLQHRCFMADGTIVDLVPAPLSTSIIFLLVLTLVLGGTAWAVSRAEGKRLPGQKPDNPTSEH